ncbi:hypothetical protein T439DRAFT_349225 [Meredithblackwellia eburnea MCA 4105]
MRAILTLLSLFISLALIPTPIRAGDFDNDVQNANRKDTGADWYIAYSTYTQWNPSICQPLVIDWRAPLNETATAHLTRLTTHGWRTVETYKNLKRVSLNSKEDIAYISDKYDGTPTKSYFIKTSKQRQWGSFLTNVTMNGHTPQIISNMTVRLELEVPGKAPVTTKSLNLAHEFGDEYRGLWHFTPNCTLVYDLNPDGGVGDEN